MIRANRNNQRRAQRRSEQAKTEEEEEEEEVEEENAKHQAENHNPGGQTDEHQVKHQAGCLEKHESKGGEDKEDITGVNVRAEEESVQQQHTDEEARNIHGSHLELLKPDEKSRASTEEAGNNESSEMRERGRDIGSESREEVAGLVYIDYSQFDEDEEINGSSYHLGGSNSHLGGRSYHLGGSTYLGDGRSEDSYNISQAGVASVDTDPIGMTDEKVKILIKGR